MSVEKNEAIAYPNKALEAKLVPAAKEAAAPTAAEAEKKAEDWKACGECNPELNFWFFLHRSRSIATPAIVGTSNANQQVTKCAIS